MKLLATTLAVLAVSSLQAAKIAADDFSSYPLNGVITGSNGGFGWAGNWVAGAAGTNTILNQVGAGATPFSYGTPGGVQSLGSSIDRSPVFTNVNTGTVNNALTRTLQTPTSATDVYVSFLVRYTAGTFSTGPDNFYLFFGTAGTTGQRFDMGLSDNGTADFYSRTSDTATNSTGGSVSVGPSTTTTYFLVGKLTKNGTTDYSRFTFWLNPTGSIVSEPAFTGQSSASTDTTDITSVASLGFGYSNLEAGDNFQIDNIQVGTTWADVVTPVPFGVDSTVGLGLLGAAAAWKLRRRRSVKA